MFSLLIGKSMEINGGFDCSTEVMAMGEVLEGLKGNNGGKYVKKEDKEEPVTHLEYYLYILKEYAEAYSYINNNGKTVTVENKKVTGGRGSGVRKQTVSTTENLVKDIFTTNPALYEALIEIAGIKGNTSNLYKLTPENIEAIKEGDEKIETREEYGLPGRSGRKRTRLKITYTNKELDKYLDSQEQLEAIMDKFFLYKGETLSLEGEEDELNGTQSAYNYIRWESY